MKEKVFYNVGQAVGESINFISNLMAIVFGLIVIGGIFVNLNGNKESIYGVILCSILSVLLIIVVVKKIRTRL